MTPIPHDIETKRAALVGILRKERELVDDLIEALGGTRGLLAAPARRPGRPRTTELRTVETVTPVRRRISAAGRRNIQLALKKRWAKFHREQKATTAG